VRKATPKISLPIILEIIDNMNFGPQYRKIPPSEAKNRCAALPQGVGLGVAQELQAGWGGGERQGAGAAAPQACCRGSCAPAAGWPRANRPPPPPFARRRLALVTAAKAVALALTPGIEVIRLVTLWSKKRGLGPYVEFLDSAENLDPDWHPEQVELFDFATDVKVGGGHRGAQVAVHRAGQNGGLLLRHSSRCCCCCGGGGGGGWIAGSSSSLPPRPARPACLCPPSQLSATSPRTCTPRSPQVNAARIGAEPLGEFLHVASLLQPLYAGRALELEMFGKDQASLATASPIADCFEIAYYCVRNSMLHPKFRRMPPLHTYIWLGGWRRGLALAGCRGCPAPMRTCLPAGSGAG
jgi:hypothetical protein